MGKAVPKAIKQKANVLLTEFPESFSKDFEKNKAVINSFELPLPKISRNLIAGFITRKMAQASKAKA